MQDDHSEVGGPLSTHPHNTVIDCKLLNLSPVHKLARVDSSPPVKSEFVQQISPHTRDEYSVFGEYIANELRSLKGEKNLLVAKKKIQDVIFEVKMGMICEPRTENSTTVYSHNSSNLQIGKIYSSPSVLNTATHMEPLNTSQTPPTTGISEIIINGACHYTNFKVDSQ